MKASGPADHDDNVTTQPTGASAEMIAVDPDDFVAKVKPILQQQNPSELLQFLKSHYTKEQMIAIVRGRHVDARKVAALCLSLVGNSCCIPEICKLLQDADPCVNQVAEHALWSIWFRAGSDEANHQLARGAQALERRDIQHALSHFDNAIQLCPDFAEAYNQRALAHCMLEDFEESLKDCQQAVQRMPPHFGAWAGMGHNYAHLGNFPKAIEAYEQALAINPHLNEIREAVAELRSRA